MASQSLYRKWRSQTFHDLIGQEPIIRTLQNTVQSNGLAHAYLFAGPRGTGKTSTARLLAKAVNCQNPVNGEPCNTCVLCKEITEGRSMDIIEIDAASNRGIDEIRDLREKVGFSPTSGKYKFYIIDEVHMLTNEAFNALLKTLEEPPPQTIFVLATTEAHKLPATVISRCQRFEFRRIKLQQIVERLGYVAEQEEIKLEPAAAEMIARAASGGMRDALSLLDQARAYCGNEITLEPVRSMLGMADPTIIRNLIQCVAEQRSADGIEMLNTMATSGIDLRQVHIQISDYWRALMLVKSGADVTKILDRSEEEVTEYTQLSKNFELAELVQCTRIFAQNDTFNRSQVSPQLALELAFIDTLELHRRGGKAEQTVPVQTIAAPKVSNQVKTAAPEPMKVQEAAPEMNIPVETLNLDESGSGESYIPEPAVKVADHIAPSETEQVEISGEPDSIAGTDQALQQVQKQWDTIKKATKQKSSTVAALLHSAVPVDAVEGERMEITANVEYKFHLDKLKEPQSRTAVEWAAERILERPVSIKFVLGGKPNSSAAPKRSYTKEAPSSLPASTDIPPSEVSGQAAPAQERKPGSTLEETVLQDKVVQEALKTFQGQLVNVKPLFDED